MISDKEKQKTFRHKRSIWVFGCVGDNINATKYFFEKKIKKKKYLVTYFISILKKKKNPDEYCLKLQHMWGCFCTILIIQVNTTTTTTKYYYSNEFIILIKETISQPQIMAEWRAAAISETDKKVIIFWNKEMRFEK